MLLDMEIRNKLKLKITPGQDVVVRYTDNDKVST